MTVADNRQVVQARETQQDSHMSWVAVIGAPNAGKSTLVNRIVGAKISIVSHKVQTTRTRVHGIIQRDQTQLAFIDTPGLFAPRHRLERAMVQAAWKGTVAADKIVLLVDARVGITDRVRAISAALQQKRRQAILALNKIDLIEPSRLLKLVSTLNAVGDFTETFMISAVTGDGVADLVALLVRQAPVGPWLFHDNALSDMPMCLLAAEITREQIFLRLHQELPYALTVRSDRWEEREDGSVQIHQTIIVLRENQRAIVLGRGGSRVKSIGWAARQELEETFTRRVHLFLAVKVDSCWLANRSYYREWSLNFDV